MFRIVIDVEHADKRLGDRKPDAKVDGDVQDRTEAHSLLDAVLDLAEVAKPKEDLGWVG